MEQREDAAAVEETLRGRRTPRHQHQSLTPTVTTATATYGAEGSNVAEIFNQELNGTAIFLSKEHKDNGAMEVFFSETKSSRSLSSLPLSEKSPKEQIAQVTSVNHGDGAAEYANFSSVEERRRDVTEEIYLENVYEKPDTHKFFCPNCNTCIQKVIIRDGEWQSSSAQAPESIGTFRCTSCFSFLIPIGNLFFPNWASNEEEPSNEQETNVVPDSSELDTPPNGTPQAPNIPAAAILNAPSPVIPVGFSRNGRIAYPEEDGRDNVGDPKRHTTQRGIVADGGINLSDARKEQNADQVETEQLPASTSILIDEGVQAISVEPRGDNTKLEILRSIVYGGLAESIASLSVVTSAASADATTVSIVALALANLIGGLFTISHNLKELKNEQPGGASDQINEGVDRYQELLGQRQNFILHATVAVLSFLVFGLVPPIVYGFSFQESNYGDYKLVAVLVASLICIMVLSLGKAHVRKPPRRYVKTLLYYIVGGVMASGVSYIAGDLIKMVIEKFGWFKSGVAVTLPIAGMGSGKPESWAYY